MAIKRAHVYISGRVQGVFYRAFVSERAKALGLNGWVRNLFDGRVEALFEGSPQAVDEMIGICRQGPPHAHVDTILTDESQPAEGLSGFEVKSSA